MNSVYIIAFFLLSASFCTAIQERSPRAEGWQTVTNPADSKYLALLKVNEVPTCSGSIPSKWTLLTFCLSLTNDSNAKAYAGMLAVEDEKPESGVQERNVKKVVADEHLPALKICTLDQMWVLDTKVSLISVSPSSSVPVTACTVLGFGLPSTRDDKRVARMQNVNITTDIKVCEGVRSGVFGSKIITPTTPDNEKLGDLDIGGPLVCSGVQHGINKIYNAAEDEKKCNLYIAIFPHQWWIQQQIKEADPAVAAGEPGEPNATTTSPSSGYSIHSYLNKYSNWKVLLLCLVAIKFLVY